jgi:hypothetical protein
VRQRWTEEDPIYDLPCERSRSATHNGPDHTPTWPTRRIPATDEGSGMLSIAVVTTQ